MPGFCSIHIVPRSNCKNLLNLAAAFLSSGAAVTPAPGQTSAPPAAVAVPIKLHQGDLLVEARVNGSDFLTFKLDTGFGITTISPNRADSLHLQRAGGLTIDGIAGEERADTFRGAEFSFEGMTFRPRRVAALPSERQTRQRTRDGILGADFFRRFVVEIDVPSRRMRLYEPSGFTYSGTGQVIPLQFRRDTPIIEAVIQPPDREPVTGRFEIDTGCDDCLCLGHDFVSANRLLDNAKPRTESARRGVGGSAPTQHGTLDELRLGELVVKKPSANFFLEGSPAGNGQAGHIGLGALQRFKMIFDYGHRKLILEPTH